MLLKELFGHCANNETQNSSLKVSHARTSFMALVAPIGEMHTNEKRFYSKPFILCELKARSKSKTTPRILATYRI